MGAVILTLIFGGAYQGKLAYALERFEISDSEVYRCDDETTVIPAGNRVVYELDKWVLALTKAGIDTEEAVKGFIAENKDAVVICNDISCGVVPADPLLRKWREAVGRALSEIAGQSDEVVRLFCGIPTIIKIRNSEFGIRN